MISEAQWEALFSSAGYREYFVYSDSLRKKAVLRECFQLVFDPRQSQVRDSLLQLPQELNPEFFKRYIVQNLNNLRLKSDKAKRYLDTTDFKSMISNANRLVKNYLPKSLDTTQIGLYPLFIAAMGPDGQVVNEAIVLDLNLMMDLGTDGVIGFLAHEFHHAYRNQHLPQLEDPLLIELNRIHQEGLADLIDKQPPPDYMVKLLPPFLVEEYKKDFDATPQILSSLDSIVVNYATGKLTEGDYKKHLSNYFRFGGHLNGYHMALKIKGQLGVAALIDSFDSPIQFVKLYQQTLKIQTGKAFFSKAFMEYLEGLN